MKTKKKFEKLEELVLATRDNLKLAVLEARKATKRAEAACHAADEARSDLKRVERMLSKELSVRVAEKEAKKKKAAKKAKKAAEKAKIEKKEKKAKEAKKSKKAKK